MSDNLEGQLRRALRIPDEQTWVEVHRVLTASLDAQAVPPPAMAFVQGLPGLFGEVERVYGVHMARRRNLAAELEKAKAQLEVVQEERDVLAAQLDAARARPDAVSTPSEPPQPMSTFRPANETNTSNVELKPVAKADEDPWETETVFGLGVASSASTPEPAAEANPALEPHPVPIDIGPVLSPAEDGFDPRLALDDCIDRFKAESDLRVIRAPLPAPLPRLEGSAAPWIALLQDLWRFAKTYATSAVSVEAQYFAAPRSMLQTHLRAVTDRAELVPDVALERARARAAETGGDIELSFLGPQFSLRMDMPFVPAPERAPPRSGLWLGPHLPREVGLVSVPVEWAHAQDLAELAKLFGPGRFDVIVLDASTTERSQVFLGALGSLRDQGLAPQILALVPDGHPVAEADVQLQPPWTAMRMSEALALLRRPSGVSLSQRRSTGS